MIISLFLTTNSIHHDAYYYERITFRAAWISVTQVPIIYLFAVKINIPGTLLSASSYVDVNWLHRWASRTLLVTATVHGSFFIREWARANFFSMELQMMPMVKYGLALWGLLAWATLSSLLPLRRWCYEFFVLQHIATAAAFLWLLHVHVPAYARYNVWMAVAFLLLGRGYRSCIFVYQNTLLHSLFIKAQNPLKQKFGYTANIQAFGNEITVLAVPHVPFSWQPGQPILLCV